MPCLRRFDSDVRRFQVSDLTNHDDVRVLTQEGSQCLRKAEAYPGVDVDLVDAFQVDFRGVFGRGNVSFWCVQYVQAGIKGNRFA